MEARSRPDKVEKSTLKHKLRARFTLAMKARSASYPTDRTLGVWEASAERQCGRLLRLSGIGLG